jgi:NAD(P)H-hydrate epimerase
MRDVLLRLGAISRPLLLALDLPTGLNADTGEVDPACPSADLTVALGLPKVGLLTFPGAARVGQLRVVDIGLPTGLAVEEQIPLELLTASWVGHHLPPRLLDSHKGTFGHALVVAGSRSYVGAAYLAAQAAVRVGAGVVTLAAPRGIYPVVASKLTEVVHLPLPEDAEGQIHPDAARLVRDKLSTYSSLAVGCGLGRSLGIAQFLEQLLLLKPRPALPTVVDADGLNNLSRLPNWWQRLGDQVALTPHPGEMATLASASSAQVQQDRIATARQRATRWNTTLALKGAYTVVAEHGGLVRVSPFANPALASGGTGDVLTGIIAGLMAQGLTPYEATCCGVYLHGQAAEAVRRDRGDTGTLASDLIERLPETISQLRQAK